MENLMEKRMFCPNCGENLRHPSSLVNEYWLAERTIFFCFCRTCYWQGEITTVHRMITTEMEE